jgi:D-sedoheptulose 7-phosphate isomerase
MLLGDEAFGVLEQFVAAHPAAGDGVNDSLPAAAAMLVECWRSGGSLYLCGNGGSHADALHIAGELVKSFERPRPVDGSFAAAVAGSPHAADLMRGLQVGLPAVTLGANGSVASAIANDIDVPGIGLAQELSALGRPGDVLWALSTSGSSRSTVLAATVARAIGIRVIAFTGPAGPANELATLADVNVAAPGSGTAEVQGWHVRLYHCLCGMVEAELFPGAAPA